VWWTPCKLELCGSMGLNEDTAFSLLLSIFSGWETRYWCHRQPLLRWEVQFAVDCKLVRYCNTLARKYHWNPLLWCVIPSLMCSENSLIWSWHYVNNCSVLRSPTRSKGLVNTESSYVATLHWTYKTPSTSISGHCCCWDHGPVYWISQEQSAVTLEQNRKGA
jgi:hypothetical protein